MFTQRMYPFLAAAALVMLVPAPLVAQEPDAAPEREPMAAPAAPSAEQQAEMMERWMEYATPGEAHQRLARHAGDWAYTMTSWMAPGAPPQQSTGTLSASMTMGGRYLVENWTGSAMGQPFEGHSVIAYDKFEDEYVSTWIDNMSTGIMISRGSYDEEQEALVMTGTYDDLMTGQADQTARGITTMPDENTLHFEMYAMGPDGEEFKTMEIHATRKR